MTWLQKRYWLIILIACLLLLLVLGWMILSTDKTDKLPLRGVYVTSLLTKR